MSKHRVRVPKGYLWVKSTKSRDGRKGFEFLEDGVAAMKSDCIGFDGDCQVLVMPDQATGETTFWAVINGQWTPVERNGTPIE